MTLWLLVPLAVALTHSVVLSRITLLGVHPNLTLAVVMAWGMLRGQRAGLAWALAGGLVLDLFSVAPLGTFTLPLLVVVALSSLLELTVFRLTLWLPVAAIVIGAPLYQLLALAVLKSLGWPAGWDRTLELLLPTALVCGALMIVVFPLMRRLSQLAGRPAIDWRPQL